MARILLIDYERSWRRFCTDALKQLGHEIITVEDAAQAFDLIPSAMPDLIIVDLWRPLSSRLRIILQMFREAYPAIPVVVHGADNDPGLALIDCHVTNTPDFGSMMETISALLRKIGRRKRRRRRRRMRTRSTAMLREEKVS